MERKNYDAFQRIAEHFAVTPYDNGDDDLSIQVRCPCHDDQTPSLSISLKTGKLLVNCFGPCDNKDVIMYLKKHNLWPTEPKLPAFQQIYKEVLDHDESTFIIDSYLETRGLPTPESIPAIMRVRRSFSVENQAFQAILVKIQAIDGSWQGTHAILLDDDFKKASIDSPKRTYGALKGGYVRLREDQNSSILFVCEGIETGFGIMDSQSNGSIYCALSCTNLAKAYIPEQFQTIYICADNDEK